MKTSSSYERLEAEHLQETKLDFYFGTKFTPRKRTVAERSEDRDTSKCETGAPGTEFSSITAWLADVKPRRSFTRYNIC